MRFGPDGKLYIFMGDQGRRGWLQNLANGPFETEPFVDDTFGGPAPDNAHLSGVILRLNDDGSTPLDNPFFAVGAAMGGEVGANIQKIFSYGHRNAIRDGLRSLLWRPVGDRERRRFVQRTESRRTRHEWRLDSDQGPQHRFFDFKDIEVNQFGGALQQVRFPPTRLADSPGRRTDELFMLPGAKYVDPELSWKYESGPAGTTFVTGAALGAENDGTLWIGSSRSFAQVGGSGGSLFRLRLTRNRRKVDVSDPTLAERCRRQPREVRSHRK